MTEADLRKEHGFHALKKTKGQQVVFMRTAREVT